MAMIIAIPPKAPAARARPVFGEGPTAPTPLDGFGPRGVAWGMIGGGPITEGDPPCTPSNTVLFEGGPPVPAWVALELRGEKPTSAQLAYLRRLGIADAPRDKDQASEWIDEALKWKALVP